MKNILAICGSIRKESVNMGALLAFKELSAPFFNVEIFDEISSFPHFSPDIDFNSSVLSFKSKLAKCDALIISTPEYAHGIPGVLKNALDWVVSDEKFPNTKVGVIFASTGDAEFVKRSLLEVLRTMSADIDEELTMSIVGPKNKISKTGELLNDYSSEQFMSFIKKLT